MPKSVKTLSNSVANFCFNLFGYFPAPFLYGVVYEASGGGKSHAGLASIQFFGITLFIVIAIATFRQKVYFSKEVQQFAMMLEGDDQARNRLETDDDFYE